jgi:hypothetical protein
MSSFFSLLYIPLLAFADLEIVDAADPGITKDVVAAVAAIAVVVADPVQNLLPPPPPMATTPTQNAVAPRGLIFNL